MAEWDPTTARRGRRAAGRATARGVAAAARAETARGCARTGAETASGVAVAARATILSLNLPERTRASARGDGRERETARRAKTRRGRSTLAFRCLPKGETCSSCDPPRGMPGKEWRPRRRRGDYRYRKISRAGPTRQSWVLSLLSWWHRPAECRGYFWARANLANLATQERPSVFRLDRNRGSTRVFERSTGCRASGARAPKERRLPCCAHSCEEGISFFALEIGGHWRGRGAAPGHAGRRAVGEARAR